MKKYIIGLGCSWTQGQGGYPKQVWDKCGGQLKTLIGHDYHLRKYEIENSWVNVLCRDYFFEYSPINLGVKGVGNRAALNQLHFCDKIDFENSTGIIVFLVSGLHRTDVFAPYPQNTNFELDFYSNGYFKHYKWQHLGEFIKNERLSNYYDLWTEEQVACEFAMNLINLQLFCERYNFKLIFANAFEPLELKSRLRQYTGPLYNKIKWDSYFQNPDYISFMQHLINLDGLISEDDYYSGEYYNFYKNQSYPTKYLTNGNGPHPTIDGYKAIALELSSLIKQII